MQMANVRLKINQFGSDVPLYNVTPAECAMYAHPKHGFVTNTGSFPLHSLEILGEAPEMVFDVDLKVWVVSMEKGAKPRTKLQEMARLKRKFRADSMKEVFGADTVGSEKNLYDKFSEIPGWSAPDAKRICEEDGTDYIAPVEEEQVNV